MENIIKNIIKLNNNIFVENPKVKKINVGFTNTIYDVDNKFIIKVCTNINNEENFKKEIEFYKANKNNNLIPKLYYSNTVFSIQFCKTYVCSKSTRFMAGAFDGNIIRF